MNHRWLATIPLITPALGWAHGTGGVPHGHGDALAWAGLAAATALCWGLYSGMHWLLRQRRDALPQRRP